MFLPMAFLGGSTGVIYRQFSVTIVSAMVLSVLVALILTPALCASLLKPKKEGHNQLRGPFGWFNKGFNWTNKRYTGGVGRMISGSVWSMLAFVIIAGTMVFFFAKLPTGFLPDEDQALVFGQTTLPQGSTAEQTDAVNERVIEYLLTSEKANVATALSVVGFNFAGQGQNAGFLVISLKPWSDRPLASQSGAAVAARVTQHFAGTRDAMILTFQPPAVLELGNASGFDMELIDRGNVGHDKLLAARNQLLGMAASDPRVMAVRPNGVEDASQYNLIVDRAKANAFGVTTADINTFVEGALGSIYVNQFLRAGRVKQVYVQGEDYARMLPDDLGKWYLRNSNSGLVPFSAIATGKWLVGPQNVQNYNGSTSYEILGAPGSGGSTGTAIAAMQEMAAKLPTGIGYEWTGLSFEEVQAGSQTTALFSISGVVILFCLAALYESWAIPIAVLLVAPLGVLGAVIATSIRGLDNDVYFQVGLLTTVRLAVKNAILIVEFAKEFYEEGATLRDAALKAARERLRPVLMTSLASSAACSRWRSRAARALRHESRSARQWWAGWSLRLSSRSSSSPCSSSPCSGCSRSSQQ